MAYFWLSNVELAQIRVSVRVQRGGHDVPPADIERRYWHGLRNFFRIYLPLVNRWVLCDNSVRNLVLVARGRLGEAPTIYDQARFDRINDAAKRDCGTTSQTSQKQKTSQHSYYFLDRFILVFVFLGGRPIGTALSRLPSKVSILLMNRSDPNGYPLKVDVRIVTVIRSSSGSCSSLFQRSPL